MSVTSSSKRELMESARSRARELLRTELGDEYFTLITDEMMLNFERRGYVTFYLSFMVDLETFSTAAKTIIVLLLAKCDLDLGKKLEETVFDCCRRTQDKDIIRRLLNLNNGETIQVKITKLLEFRDEFGHSCLMICVGLLNEHGLKYPTSDLVSNPFVCQHKRNMEETILWLIELGIANGVNVAKVIDQTTTSGDGFFSQMTAISEKVAKFLTTMNVKANSIDSNFQTVTVNVRTITTNY